jgi:hypothetical protein
MTLHPNRSTPPSAYLFDANQNVRIAPSPSITEGEDILKQLALVIIGRAVEQILFALKVKRRAFVLVKQRFNQQVLHGPVHPANGQRPSRGATRVRLQESFYLTCLGATRFRRFLAGRESRIVAVKNTLHAVRVAAQTLPLMSAPLSYVMLTVPCHVWSISKVRSIFTTWPPTPAEKSASMAPAAVGRRHTRQCLRHPPRSALVPRARDSAPNGARATRRLSGAQPERNLKEKDAGVLPPR